MNIYQKQSKQAYSEETMMLVDLLLAEYTSW